MAFEGRFFPDFFVEVRLAEALLFVEAFVVEAFVVEALLRLAVPLRFLLEAALLFLRAAFLVPFAAFLVPFFERRELVDPLEDLALLIFFAADRLRAFVVGMLSSSIAPCGTVGLPNRDRAPMVANAVAGCPADDALANGLAAEGTSVCHKATPSIVEEALPVVD